MNTERIEKELAMLGHRVEDKVSGLKGGVTSVSFDLYGCVQDLVTLEAGGEKGMRESWWMDSKRLKRTGKTKARVMALPPSVAGDGSVNGPAAKPVPSHASGRMG